MNYCGLSTFDTANGEGVRVSLFVSGCTLHCKGCFNKESWDFNAGKRFTKSTLETILKELDNDYITGLSILGGDPLESENLPEVEKLCKAVRKKFGKKKTIWLWTGRCYEKVKQLSIIKHLDVLIDGPFVEKLKVTERGALRGSTNQRIIYLRQE